jgi:hypothetical protein
MILRWLVLAVVASCGQSPPDPAVPSSAAPTCDSWAPARPNERRLYAIAAQRRLETTCIPPGRWDLTVGSGPSYEPHVKNCTKTVFDAAKSVIEPNKLITQVLHGDWMLIHFHGPNPHFYEISYRWNESEGLAMLSLVNISQTGSVLSPEGDLDAIKVAIEKAFYCN